MNLLIRNLPTVNRPIIKRRGGVLRALLTFGAVALGAMAPAAAAEKPRLGGAKEQDIVVEKRYQFYVRGFRKPVVFDPAGMTFAPREVTARPEELVMRALAARAKGEVKEYLDLWTEEARGSMRSGWEAEGISREQVGQRWRASFGGAHVELTHYVDFDVADLIRYRLFDPATGAERGSGELAFRIADDGLWRLFELEDPLFLANWRFEGSQKTMDLVADPNPASR